MDNDKSRREYPLGALIRRQTWELDAARAVALEARGKVDRHAEISRRIGQSVADLEGELRDMYGRGESIDRDQQQVKASYLAVQRGELRRSVEELRKAELAYEASRRKLLTIKQGEMVLEKHRDGWRQARELDQRRNEQQSLDESWLLGSGRQPDNRKK